MSTIKKKKSRKIKNTPKRPFIPSDRPRSTEDSVQLVQGKGTKLTGGSPGGQYWHIYENNIRVGRIYINLINKQDKPPHASITIEINIKDRGHGIGTIAYRKACEESIYNEIYATIRKSNIASFIAAERAGFHLVENHQGREYLLVWNRK